MLCSAAPSTASQAPSEELEQGQSNVLAYCTEQLGMVVAVVIQVGDELLSRLLDQLASKRQVPNGCVRCLTKI